MKDWSLEQLKEKADSLGIKYSASLKNPETLLKKIEAEILLLAEEEELNQEAAKGTHADSRSEEEIAAENLAKAKELVRVKVSCLNPALKSRGGVRVQVGNAKLGMIGRHIPFDHEWHVERILVEELRNRQYMSFEEREGKYGIKVKDKRMVPAFNVIELAPLTKAELEQLAEDQRVTGRLED